MQEKGIEKKDLFVSITAVVLCAAFGMIYELFGHGVYSLYQIRPSKFGGSFN